MGNAGELIATEYNVGRAAQDEFAFNSHRKAAEADAAGRFKGELLPVTIPQKKGDPIVARDESVRADTSVTALGALKPAFRKDGTVTAGNAPPVNDGAAALVVMSTARAAKLGLKPLARIVGQATRGVGAEVSADDSRRGRSASCRRRSAGSSRTLTCSKSTKRSRCS